MDSLSDLPSVRPSTNETIPSDHHLTGNIFFLGPDVTSSNEPFHPANAISTSLSATTPRTCHLLPHEPASLMDAAKAPLTSDDTKLLTYTADVQQSSEVTECTSQSTTKQNSQLDSTLLSRLPRELRDKIWREAVIEDDEIPIRVTQYETEDGEHRHRLQIEHAMLRVCKQTRQEVADIYYLENVFCITDDLVETQCIRELSKFLAPWAERMKKLGVLHKYVPCKDNFSIEPCKDDFTEIKFSIYASQGRLHIELGTFSARRTFLTCDVEDGTTAWDSTTTYGNMCFCKVVGLAIEHGSGNVVDWVKDYADVVLQSELLRKYGGPHCWDCAGRIIF
jgi:hypothetical protein